MLANALHVASVSQAWRRAVARLVAHGLEGVVVWVAIGKSVGHEHVEHIGVGESHALVARHVAVFQQVFHLLGLLALLEAQRHLARLGPFEVEVDEEIVGRVEACDRIDAHPRVAHFHVGAAHILAVHHQLQRGVFHAYIPVGGLNAVDPHRCVHAHCTHKHH